MKNRIFALGAGCVLMLTACSSGAVQTTAGQGGAASGADPIQVENVESQVISVTGRETVNAVPDMAEIVFGVTTQNQDAAACQQENNKKVTQLVETLMDSGIGENSIQTSGQELSPRYDWQNDGKITGYESTTQVTVSDVGLDQVGTVLSQSVDAGVNQVQSVTYLSSTYDESYQEALKLALEQARAKAQALAEAGGCTLGDVVQITEYSDSQQGRYVNSAMSSVAAADISAGVEEAMTVMPGEIAIEASISVEFGIE